MDCYVTNYLRAIDHPLPELRASFEAELAFLESIVTKESVVLDVGCGAGRPANILAPFVKKIVGLDNDSHMLKEAAARCTGLKNVELIEGVASQLPFPNDHFDGCYATYNLVGEVPQHQRQQLLNEMARVTKRGGFVLNVTWKTDDPTTTFLKKYYPSIGIEIREITPQRTTTSKGVFDRLRREELTGYYVVAGLRAIRCKDIGPVWMAASGVKNI